MKRRQLNNRMIPKKLAPAKAGVADFSDQIIRTLQESDDNLMQR
jgi:hypothetical protein